MGRPTEQWMSHRIRDSECLLPPGVFKGMCLLGAEGEAVPYKFSGDILAVLIDDNSTKASGASAALQDAAGQLREGGANKVFYLDGGFQAFNGVYPYQCFGDDSSSEDQAEMMQTWPAEVIPGRLYLGTIENAKSQHQREALGLSLVVNLGNEHGDTDCGATPVKHFPTSPDPDVRVPLHEGLAAIEEVEGPVLVCCGDGIVLSPALAVAQVMMALRMPHMRALAYVMKRKRNAAPHKTAFMQLQELQDALGLAPQ